MYNLSKYLNLMFVPAINLFKQQCTLRTLRKKTTFNGRVSNEEKAICRSLTRGQII